MSQLARPCRTSSSCWHRTQVLGRLCRQISPINVEYLAHQECLTSEVTFVCSYVRIYSLNLLVCFARWEFVVGYVPKMILLEPPALPAVSMDVVVVHDHDVFVMDERVVIFVRVFEEVLATWERIRREEFESHPGVSLRVQRPPEHDLKARRTEIEASTSPTKT